MGSCSTRLPDMVEILASRFSHSGGSSDMGPPHLANGTGLGESTPDPVGAFLCSSTARGTQMTMVAGSPAMLYQAPPCLPATEVGALPLPPHSQSSHDEGSLEEVG